MSSLQHATQSKQVMPPPMVDGVPVEAIDAAVKSHVRRNRAAAQPQVNKFSLAISMALELIEANLSSLANALHEAYLEQNHKGDSTRHATNVLDFAREELCRMKRCEYKDYGDFIGDMCNLESLVMSIAALYKEEGTYGARALDSSISAIVVMMEMVEMQEVKA